MTIRTNPPTMIIAITTKLGPSEDFYTPVTTTMAKPPNMPIIIRMMRK